MVLFGYFTTLDYFMDGSTILVFLSLIPSLTTSYFGSIERKALASRIGVTCHLVLTSVFATVVIV